MGHEPLRAQGWGARIRVMRCTGERGLDRAGASQHLHLHGGVTYSVRFEPEPRNLVWQYH